MYVYKIKFASFNFFLLNNYLNFLKNYLTNLKVNYTVIKLPKKKILLTLLKSPHVNKKSKEQFNHIKYNAVIIINCSYEIPLKFLLLNLPSEIFTKVTFIH